MHAPPLVNGTGAERMPCVEARPITTNVAWPVSLALPVVPGKLHPVSKPTFHPLASAAPPGGSAAADVPEGATNSSVLFEQLCDHLERACQENGISIRTIVGEAKEVKDKVEARMLQMCSSEQRQAYDNMCAPGTPSHSASIIAGNADDMASGNLVNKASSLPTATSLDVGSVAAPDSPFEVADHEDEFVGRESSGGATPLSSPYETESSKERRRKAMCAVIEHMRRHCSAGAMALFDEERKRMREKRKR